MSWVDMPVSDYVEIPDIPALVAQLDAPTRAWVDNCYAVSHSIVRCFPELRAAVQEGYWIGEVAEVSYFRQLVDLGLGENGLNHWWLVLPDGRVLDATRWVFEGREPYVYCGPADSYRSRTEGRKAPVAAQETTSLPMRPST